MFPSEADRCSKQQKATQYNSSNYFHMSERTQGRFCCLEYFDKCNNQTNFHRSFDCVPSCIWKIHNHNNIETLNKIHSACGSFFSSNSTKQGCSFSETCSKQLHFECFCLFLKNLKTLDLLYYDPIIISTKSRS